MILTERLKKVFKRLEYEFFSRLKLKKEKQLQYEYLRKGPENGWTMRADLYAKCPKCGYYMSLDPTQGDICTCGNLHKDVDWGRLGANTGDDSIEIYQKKF